MWHLIPWKGAMCQTEGMRAGMLDRRVLSQKKKYPWAVAWGNSPQHRADPSCKARQVEIWIMICLATCRGDWVIQFRFRLYTQNGSSTAHFQSWTRHNKFSVKLGYIDMDQYLSVIVQGFRQNQNILPLPTCHSKCPKPIMLLSPTLFFWLNCHIFCLKDKTPVVVKQIKKSFYMSMISEVIKSQSNHVWVALISATSFFKAVLLLRPEDLKLLIYDLITWLAVICNMWSSYYINFTGK